MRNNLNTFIRPGIAVMQCKKIAKDLLESLDRRFEYVLTDTNYLLGTSIGICDVPARLKKNTVRRNGIHSGQINVSFPAPVICG